jgi:hypothetical protein
MNGDPPENQMSHGPALAGNGVTALCTRVMSVIANVHVVLLSFVV